LLLLDFWKRRFKQQFIEYARETKMPGSTDEERLQHYMEKVGDALAKAKQFNASFNRQQGKDSIYYLFSSRLKLAMRFILDTENGSLEIIRRESLVGGDGRVPRQSATNQKYREIDTGHIYQLDAGHGELRGPMQHTHRSQQLGRTTPLDLADAVRRVTRIVFSRG